MITNSKETDENVSFLFACGLIIYPLLDVYGYASLGLGFLFMITITFFFYLKHQVLYLLYPSILLPFLFYIFFARAFAADSLSSVIAPSLFFMTIFWGIFQDKIRLNTFLKVYRTIVNINIVILFLQELMYYFLGYRWGGILTFLPLRLGGNDFDSSSYAETLSLTHRSSALFSEPAHFSQFLLPLMVLDLFYISNKRSYIRFIIYTFVLLLIQSGNGLIGLFVILIFLFFFIFKKVKIGYFVLLVTLVCCFSFISGYYYLHSAKGEILMGRQNEIDPDNSDISSGFIRIFRGYYIYETLNQTEKLFGLNNQDALRRKIKQSSVAHTFGDEETYMNTVQTLLIENGYIGTFLFLLFLSWLWKNNNIAGRCILSIFCVLCFVASVYFTHTMLLYLISSYLMKKEVGKYKVLLLKLG